MEPSPPSRSSAYWRMSLLMLLATAACVVLVVVALRALETEPAAAVVVVLIGIAYVAACGLAVAVSVWQPVIGRFRPVTPAPGARSRRRQSVSVGLVNMDWSVDIAVDDAHLHLRPIRAWRVLGVGPASVPWSALAPKPGRRGRALLGEWTLRAPLWALARLGGPPGP